MRLLLLVALCLLAFAAADLAPGSPGSLRHNAKVAKKNTPSGLATVRQPRKLEKKLKLVKVESRYRKCGCLDQPVCDCRPVKFAFVSPEIKRTAEEEKVCACLGQEECPCAPKKWVDADVPSFRRMRTTTACGCVGQTGCPCGSADHVTKLFPDIKQTSYVTSDECGCLQLEVCPCRKVEYVQPKLRPGPAGPACSCLDEPVCGCRPPADAEPEYKVPCKCPADSVEPCKC